LAKAQNTACGGIFLALGSIMHDALGPAWPIAEVQYAHL